MRRRSPRELDLGVRSPAVGRTVPVRLLLPARFGSRPAPVAGPSSSSCTAAATPTSAWTRSTDIEQLAAARRRHRRDARRRTRRRPIPIGSRGAPKWETFHLVELRQLLERAYRADDPSGDRRPLDGRPGGRSATQRGTRGCSPRRRVLQRPAAPARRRRRHAVDLVDGAGRRRDGAVGRPAARCGPPWAAHDPTDLAGRLRGTRLFVSSGNGQPGPLDTAGARPDAIERFVAARDAGIRPPARPAPRASRPVSTATARARTTYPYWQRELHRSWPLLMRAPLLDPAEPGDDHRLVLAQPPARLAEQHRDLVAAALVEAPLRLPPLVDGRGAGLARIAASSRSARTAGPRRARPRPCRGARRGGP